MKMKLSSSINYKQMKERVGKKNNLTSKKRELRIEKLICIKLVLYLLFLVLNLKSNLCTYKCLKHNEMESEVGVSGLKLKFIWRFFR